MEKNKQHFNGKWNTLNEGKLYGPMGEMNQLGSWFCDLRTDERRWCDGVYRICGLPPQDNRLNKEAFLTFIHPDDRKGYLEAVELSIKNKIPFGHHIRFVRPDGSVRYVFLSGTVTYDTEGRPINMFGTIQDISHLMERELVLKQEKDKLLEYLQTANSIFLVINTDRTVEMVNIKGCELLGYPADEIEGRDWFNNYIVKKERKELLSLFDAIIQEESEVPDSYENTILTKDKGQRNIRWRNVLLKDENGKVRGLVSSGLDVTEQIKTQRKLYKSKSKNQSIIQALPDVITIHDEKGTIEEIHMPDEPRQNGSKETLKEKRIEEVLPEYFSEQLLTILSKVIDDQKMEVLNSTGPVAQGTVDYECRAVPFLSNRVLTISRDITETKNLQRMLQLRNKALDVAGNGILIVDANKPNRPIIYCNNAFTQITGYSRKEVIGLNCQFLQQDDRDQEAIATMAIAIKKGESCRVLLRNYRKDGSLFWNDLSITPLFDDNQNLTHFIGVQNDVTEIQSTKSQLEEYANTLEEKVEQRTKEVEVTVQKLVETNFHLHNQIKETKIAENKANRNQAKFAAIAQNFPKGLIAVFNANFELVYVAGEELNRVNMEKIDFLGKHVDEIPIFSVDQIEKIKVDILKTIKGESLSFDVMFQKNCYAVNSTPLKSDGETNVWALFVYNNITEQKYVQQELANALKAEQEHNELKSRFISMASHEFRTPLSAILSSAILIGKQNEPGHEEQRNKHVGRIRAHVKYLVIILNDFLSLSKLEEGKLKPKPQYFELVKFCRIMADEMDANKKEGQVIILKHSEPEIQVFLDPKFLSHILINLVSNALKYSYKNSEVSIIIKSLAAAVQLKIKDNGIGIPILEQKNLFQRFFRAHNATNIQGTGLGLHIVKQYVELMGGSVSFSSSIGKGSTFTVQLPINLEHHGKNIDN